MAANRRLILFSVFFLIPILSIAQLRNPFSAPTPEQNEWVDSVFKSLKRKERIAQMFFIRAHTDKGKAYEDSIGQIIKTDKVGGLVFFQGGPARQRDLTRRYQDLAQTPLLVAMDAEWGLGMRLDSTISYPYQLTLGAIRDTTLLYQMGRQIAKEFKIMGMHLNFAPVTDINNNPRNPVIGYRSFGDNKYNVASRAIAYMRGMQDEGILTSIKHFPGHGDTEVDSHHDLPVLGFSRQRLDSLELYPFREAIKAGALGVMVAHMQIPALDTTARLPSTLSPRIVTDLLKKELGFNGLAISDAMEMKGVVKFFPNGEADVRAVKAGNDIIELSEDTHRAIKLVKKAIRKGEISREQINTSVKKILAAKYWAGLASSQPHDTSNVVRGLNTTEAKSLNQRLADASATLLKGDSALKALNPLARTAIISLGVTETTVFQNELRRHFPNSYNFLISKIASATELRKVQSELKNYEQIVVAIHDYRKRPQSTLDYNAQLKLFIAELARLNAVTCVFANPYTMAGLPGLEASKAVLVQYQNSEESQRAAAKVVSGLMQANGRLPVNVNSFFRYGDGIDYFPPPASVTGSLGN